MLHLNLYKQFAKKENSTKQPTSSTLTLGIQGILKEPCSIMTPVVKIERLTSDAMPFDYTYAKWVEAGRYYFIEDWVWQDGLWEVHMKEDVLATFKTEIGAETEYVLRTDSTTDFNGEITDTTYPCTTDIETHSYAIPNVFTTDVYVGCFIVGIISGNSTSPVGAITYYAMDSTQFGALSNMLFSNSNLETMGIIDSTLQDLIQDLPKELAKTIYNPFQYIVSCMWFPFGVGAITDKTAVTDIHIGWWDYTLSGYRVYAQTIEIGNELFPFDHHPQSTSRGSYLDYAPYSLRYLVGRFGTVAIDSAKFKYGQLGCISYLIDLITGQCIAKIAVMESINNSWHETLIEERPFLLGVPIQMAQVGTDYLGIAMSVNNLAGDTFKGITSGLSSGGIPGAIVGGIQNAVNGIGNTIKSAMPLLETSGSNGSFLSPVNQTHEIVMYYKIVDEDIHHRGRPLCELRQLNTLSGFILCAEGEIDISCYDNERKEIMRYLTTGFFWE